MTHAEGRFNSRLDEIQAAILDVRLSWLGDFTERRRRVAGRYFEGIINPDVSLLRRPMSPENHVYHQFVVRVKDRDSFRGYLNSQGVPSDVHYPTPVHRQEAAREIKSDSDGLPASETFTAECVSIPCHPGLEEGQVDRVVDVINSYHAF